MAEEEAETQVKQKVDAVPIMSIPRPLIMEEKPHTVPKRYMCVWDLCTCVYGTFVHVNNYGFVLMRNLFVLTMHHTVYTCACSRHMYM